ncbi:MAG: SDR family oxidoreductase [Candidatus Kariarchaeaceae archaeon]|jgi:short-subunit dehydrogenase
MKFVYSYQTFDGFTSDQVDFLKSKLQKTEEEMFFIPSKYREIMNKNAEQVVLITGASKGIGKATAEYLVENGYSVYGTARDPSKYNLDFPVLALDVTDDNSVNECIKEIIEKEGRIDVLVNNAGFGIVGPLADTSIDDMKQQFDTNFFGVHRMVLAVLPHMEKQKTGKIVSIGSFGSRYGNAYQSLYSTSKAALAMYSDALKIELYTSRITVSLVEPGDIKTDFDAGRRNATNFDPESNEVAKRVLAIYKKGEMNGNPPIKVAKTIHKIIRSKRPKPRYTVGFDAKFFGTLIRLLPYTLHERVNMIYYKIPRK